MHREWEAERASRWLVEAMETGNPLAAFPAEIAPSDQDEAEEVAGAVLEQLGLAPCGIRVAPAADGSLITGPMLEARFLNDGAGLALDIMRHGRASAALLGVLGAALDPAATTPPEIASIHPALDVSASRYTQGPADRLAEIADLAGLGLLILGKRRPAREAPLAAAGEAQAHGPLQHVAKHPAEPADRVALIDGKGAPRGKPFQLNSAFAHAAVEARRLGGLPAGATLVVAGLGGSVLPLRAGQLLTARFTGIGKVTASIG